jgi:hypothetical protein
MKQLDRLLFEQGGDCFFCKQPLAKADASIEHLLAQANGGTNAEENVVACCKAVNALMGNKPLKDKLAIVLRQKHGFQCPAKAAAAEAATPQPTKESTKSQSIPGPAKPRPSAKQTMPTANSAIPSAISSAGIIALTRPSAASKPPVAPPASATIACPTCRRAVPSAVGQIDYVCPHCRGAFRY